VSTTIRPDCHRVLIVGPKKVMIPILGGHIPSVLPQIKNYPKFPRLNKNQKLESRNKSQTFRIDSNPI
jgi:hypothetical protein